MQNCLKREYIKCYTVLPKAHSVKKIILHLYDRPDTSDCCPVATVFLQQLYPTDSSV